MRAFISRQGWATGGMSRFAVRDLQRWPIGRAALLSALAAAGIWFLLYYVLKAL